MEKLKAKLKKQGGFTMVELLIVVAIIAILVAVSIPMMNSALEKSRHAVDQANVRDAIALASMKYLTDSDTEDFSTAKTYTYCVDNKHQGYLDDATSPAGAVKPACECNGKTGATGTKATGELKVSIQNPAAGEDKPQIKVSWVYSDTDEMTVEGDLPATP